MLSGNEYYEADCHSQKIKRRVRGPKSLVPHLVVLVDELVQAYREGIAVTDYSMARGSPGRKFRCKVMMLFWTGDYPAQALVSGTHSKTCHWCRMKSVHAPEINRRCWCDYRRYLPSDHPMRKHADYGKVETRSPPTLRTHKKFVKDACANMQHRGYKSHAPYKTTGVKHLSPLAALHMFDLVWDILPDMMHVVPGIWKRHIFAMFTGDRKPSRPPVRDSLSKRENNLLQRQYAESVEDLRRWQLPQEKRKLLDSRSMQLGGESGWVRSNIKVCTAASTLKAHDWFLLIQSAGYYLLEGIFPPGSNELVSLHMILDACALCLNATSAADSENREHIDFVKKEVIEALCVLEANLPRTELAVMNHVLLHVPDAIYRWNAVRNFWNFFGER